MILRSTQYVKGSDDTTLPAQLSGNLGAFHLIARVVLVMLIKKELDNQQSYLNQEINNNHHYH